MRVRHHKTMELLVGTLLLRPYVFAFVAAFVLAAIADIGWRRTLAFTAWTWSVGASCI